MRCHPYAVRFRARCASIPRAIRRAQFQSCRVYAAWPTGWLRRATRSPGVSMASRASVSVTPMPEFYSAAAGTVGPSPATVVRCMIRGCCCPCIGPRAVQDATVVIDDQVAAPPLMAVDELRPRREGEQVLQQKPRLHLGHTSDIRRMRADEQRLRSVDRIGAHQRVLDRRQALRLVVGRHLVIEMPPRIPMIVNNGAILDRLRIVLQVTPHRPRACSRIRFRHVPEPPLAHAAATPSTVSS